MKQVKQRPDLVQVGNGVKRNPKIVTKWVKPLLKMTKWPGMGGVDEAHNNSRN